MIFRVAVNEGAVAGVLLETADIVQAGDDVGQEQLALVQVQPATDTADLVTNPPGVFFLEDDVPLFFIIAGLERLHVVVKPVLDRTDVFFPYRHCHRFRALFTTNSPRRVPTRPATRSHLVISRK